jgi:ribose transport system ATP-binding protein
MRTAADELHEDMSVTSSHSHGFVTHGITKRFNAENVLNNVGLEVPPGQVVALLGENGAGKSTLSSIISGMFPPTSGTMTWKGKPYAPTSPRQAIDAGIALIHQETRLVPDLTVAENVFVGHPPLLRGGFVDRRVMNERAAIQLQRLGLDIAPDTIVRGLKIASQQQVEIAKALTLNSQLLILDEPTAALGHAETERLFEQIEALRRDGVSFIYISHRLEEIAQIADRVAVLRDGELVAQYDSAKVPTGKLVEDMVGRSVDRLFPEKQTPKDKTVLRVKNLTAPDRSFDDISFDVREGEVFGIAGIVGAGRTELVRGIAGLDPVESGSVELDGNVLRILEPLDAIDAGIVLVPEDRKHEGVILQQSIAENIAIPNLNKVAEKGWILGRRLQNFAWKSIKELGIKGEPQQLAGRLSGGNQQKVVIAKWLARSPRVVILDEPTRGIDMGARAAIYEVIIGFARQGSAVIVVSSDLEEVLGLADRLLVLSRGKSRGILDRQNATNHSVMELATL